MLYSLITGFRNQVVTKLSKGHEESINHFRNAEIEFLKGVRTFIDEENPLFRSMAGKAKQIRR